MFHIFLIHSLIEGHVDCFLVLAITSNASTDITEQMSCGMIEHLLSIYPIVLVLDFEVD